MKLQQKLQRVLTVITLLGISSLALSAGCEEWKNPGTRHPARNTPEQSGMTQSRWHTQGDAPTTQPSNR
jgi:hypothetical protein